MVSGFNCENGSSKNQTSTSEKKRRASKEASHVWVPLKRRKAPRGTVADPGGGAQRARAPPPPPPPPEGPAPTYTRTCTNMCTRTYANTAQRYCYGRNGLYVRLPYVHNDTWVRAKYEYDCIWRFYHVP